MKNSTIGVIALIVTMFVGILFGVIGYKFLSQDYKQGQIDALTDKVKYELIENDNRTKEWVRIPIKKE